VRLTQLPHGKTGIVQSVQDLQPNDPIAGRLRDLGFVEGEPVTVVTRGPVGGDPLLVQIGYTRFALRIREADRITVILEGNTED